MKLDLSCLRKSKLTLSQVMKVTNINQLLYIVLVNVPFDRKCGISTDYKKVTKTNSIL